jgi:hypothetical protein
MPQSWLICEESGRWAAALRMAFGRSHHVSSRPRLIEVRSLTELADLSREREADLALIEVGTANVTQVLDFAVRLNAQGTPFVALLKDTAERVRLADLLWEIGAVEVVSSPRDLRGLLELYTRLAAHSPVRPDKDFDQQAFTDWAWSLLPWQGT